MLLKFIYNIQSYLIINSQRIGMDGIKRRQLETIVIPGGLATPILNSFVGAPLEKRLATGTFFGSSAAQGYRYLRFEAGHRDTHAYLASKSTTDDQHRPNLVK